MSQDLIQINDIMVRQGPDILLHKIDWCIQKKQNWAVIGPNGSGKSTVIKALWGGVDICRGSFHFNFQNHPATNHPANIKHLIGYVSFDLHRNLLNQNDFQNQMREYAGKEEEFTTTKDIILSSLTTPPTSSVASAKTQQQAASSMQPQLNPAQVEQLQTITKSLGIQHLLDQNMHHLSTGEMRKTLIARALIKNPEILILDEPFDGLDQNSRQHLFQTIEDLIEQNIQIILIAHRLEEISPKIQQVLMLKEGRVHFKGSKNAGFNNQNISELYDCPLTINNNNGIYTWNFTIPKSQDLSIEQQQKLHQLHHQLNHQTATTTISNKKPVTIVATLPKTPFIAMKNISVAYGEKKVLSNFSWQFLPHQNWAIIGPNGAGKSTIIKLITGDNLQGYSNDIKLFGHQKGTSGQSIWEIKQKLSYVSGEIQVAYRKKITALEVIYSGFFDSIGLYQRLTETQQEIANTWIELLEIQDLLSLQFNNLSYGQQRMVILARAMVKSPKLLIVDEPCHGLDIKNRHRILNIIQRISETPTKILYVTHHSEELLPCITNTIILSPDHSPIIN